VGRGRGRGRGTPAVRIYCYTDLCRMMNNFLNHRFHGMLNINKTETPPPHIFIKINACRTQRPYQGTEEE